MDDIDIGDHVVWHIPADPTRPFGPEAADVDCTVVVSETDAGGNIVVWSDSSQHYFVLGPGQWTKPVLSEAR